MKTYEYLGLIGAIYLAPHLKYSKELGIVATALAIILSIIEITKGK